VGKTNYLLEITLAVIYAAATGAPDVSVRFRPQAILKGARNPGQVRDHEYFIAIREGQSGIPAPSSPEGPECMPIIDVVLTRASTATFR